MNRKSQNFIVNYEILVYFIIIFALFLFLTFFFLYLFGCLFWIVLIFIQDLDWEPNCLWYWLSGLSWHFWLLSTWCLHCITGRVIVWLPRNWIFILKCSAKASSASCTWPFNTLPPLIGLPGRMFAIHVPLVTQLGTTSVAWYNLHFGLMIVMLIFVGFLRPSTLLRYCGQVFLLLAGSSPTTYFPYWCWWSITNIYIRCIMIVKVNFFLLYKKWKKPYILLWID